MKKIIISVEGQTEGKVAEELLYEYFLNKGILVNYSILETRKGHRGGSPPYPRIRNELLKHLHQTYDVVTTMYDFYGLSNDFQGFDNFPNGNCYQQVEHLENAFKADILGNLNTNPDRFIPYIQIHEFEAICFISPEITVTSLVGCNKSIVMNEITKTINEFENPEHINNSTQTAPSKRLKSLFNAYNKPLHGTAIAKNLGINRIKETCPHFRNWIEKMESVLL